MPVASSHASRVYWRPTAPRCMRSFRASRTVRSNVGWSRGPRATCVAFTSSRSARRQQQVTPGVARGFPWRNAPAASMAMNPARRSPPSVPQGAGVVQKGTTSGARLHGTVRLSGDGSASVEARRRLSFVVQRPVERHAQAYRHRQDLENHVFVGNRPQTAPQPVTRRILVPTTPELSPCDKMQGQEVFRDHTP